MNRTNLPILLVLALGSAAAGQTVSLSFPVASIDRWMYPFNSERGYRSAASVFGAIGQENAFPPLSFDQRDAQFLVGFDLAPMVPPGLGACRYRVLAATLTLTVSNDLIFRYDPTYDAYTTYPDGDTDAGRPVELYGASFRGGWAACPIDPGVPALNQFPCFWEGDAQNPGPGFGPSVSSDVRYAFATDYAGGVARDVSNNVRDGFDPSPFAVGQIAGLAPGALVPVDTEMVFGLDVGSDDVQAFLRGATESGVLRLMVTSLQPASSAGGPGSGQFASFYCKEIGFDELAPRLEITVRLIPAGDADGDGVVSFPDITAVLTNWGRSGAPGITGDANCDGVVNFGDITAVLNNWGSSQP